MQCNGLSYSRGQSRFDEMQYMKLYCQYVIQWKCAVGVEHDDLGL